MPPTTAKILNDLRQEIDDAADYGKLPLLVLGAGVSHGAVPLLSEIGAWLAEQLNTVDLEVGDEWIREHTEALASGGASRRQVAELFSILQRPSPHLKDGLESIWRRFSWSLVFGGLGVGSKGFQPLSSAEPNQAHRIIASALRQSRAWVISLNFDGLVHKAFKPHKAGDGCLIRR